MTTLALSQLPRLQFFVPGTMTPLAGGLLFTYAIGTTTKQATYSNPNGTPTANTNPIVLDANGQCVCFVDATLSYTFTLAPAGDTDPPTSPYWSVDQVGYEELTASFAPLESPNFTGNPEAPTPETGDNTQSIATTQFVQAQLAANEYATETWVQEQIANQTVPVQALAMASTLTIDWTKGLMVLLTQNVSGTIAFANLPGSGFGQVLSIKRKHDASSTTWTIAWPASVKWPGGVAPTLSQSSGAVDCITFQCMGDGEVEGSFNLANG